jgi:hypothetical protein
LREERGVPKEEREQEGEGRTRPLDILMRARLRSSRPLSVGSSVGKLVMVFGVFPVSSNLGMSLWEMLILLKESQEPTQRV